MFALALGMVARRAHANFAPTCGTPPWIHLAAHHVCNVRASGRLSRDRRVYRKWHRDADAFGRAAAAFRKRAPRATSGAEARIRKWNQCWLAREFGCLHLRVAADRKMRQCIYAARHSSAAPRNRVYLETVNGKTRPQHKNKYCAARADGYLCVRPWMHSGTRPPLCVSTCI